MITIIMIIIIMMGTPTAMPKKLAVYAIHHSCHTHTLVIGIIITQSWGNTDGNHHQHEGDEHSDLEPYWKTCDLLFVYWKQNLLEEM